MNSTRTPQPNVHPCLVSWTCLFTTTGLFSSSSLTGVLTVDGGRGPTSRELLQTNTGTVYILQSSMIKVQELAEHTPNGAPSCKKQQEPCLEFYYWYILPLKIVTNFILITSQGHLLSPPPTPIRWVPKRHYMGIKMLLARPLPPAIPLCISVKTYRTKAERVWMQPDNMVS